jgi:hypothetical protein
VFSGPKLSDTHFHGKHIANILISIFYQCRMNIFISETIGIVYKQNEEERKINGNVPVDSVF